MWLIIGALLFGVGVIIFFRGMETSAAMASGLWNRLQAYREPVAAVVTEDEMEEDLKPPFRERVFGPIVARTSRFMSKRTSETRLAQISAKLGMAGRPYNLTPTGFLMVRYVGAVVGAVAFGALGSMLGAAYILLGPIAGGLFGYFMPVLWIRQKGGQRKAAIAKALPDAMDLITAVVEAGLGFDGAIGEVATRYKNVLGQEFAQVLRETKLGRARGEALMDMAARCEDSDIHNFTMAVVQSEQMGTSVAKVLRIQSSELRRVRRQRAQQKAGAAPVKMLLPMVGCIFPVIWIVLLGPAAMVLLKSFAH